MKLFDFFRRKKEPVQEEPPGLLLPGGKTISQRLAAYLPQLETVALPCIRIEAKAADNLFLFDSKFGGHAYWPAGKPYPVDSYGKPLYLLAQLNFAQIPHLAGYPDKGLLQFYVAADDYYGLNFDHPAEQTNFRVVYFEETTGPSLEDFRFLDERQRESALPVDRQLQLQFALDKDYFGYSDVRYPEELADELASVQGPGRGRRSLEEELADVFPDSGHKIGGYAYFTQDDPRRDNAYRDFVLLLQIDSQGNEIVWGDVGVGNFFIHPDALARKDFSNVLYNWDCT